MTNMITFVLSLSFLGLQLPGMDVAVMKKWSTPAVIKYHVEGLHKGRESVVTGDQPGKADVIDRITVEFTWDNKKDKIVGPVTVVDGKSELTNIKSDGTNCPPPQLKGEYEHFQSGENSMIGNQIQIDGTRIYPAASISQYPASCDMVPAPGGKEDAHLWVAALGPQVLGMPSGPAVSVAADKKSFSIEGAEKWVWTYTPTVVQ